MIPVLRVALVVLVGAAASIVRLPAYASSQSMEASARPSRSAPKAPEGWQADATYAAANTRASHAGLKACATTDFAGLKACATSDFADLKVCATPEFADLKVCATSDFADLKVCATPEFAHRKARATTDNAAEDTITFNKDIAPIVFEHCASCHREGEVGPFSLITYDEVKRHATQIASVTERRVMPPWKPEPGYGKFAGERVLTDRQIQLIRDWVAQGTIEGSPGDIPAMSQLSESSGGWRLGPPDLIVSMPQSYTVAAGGGDVFRTFVIAIPTTTVRYVKALEFRPGNPRAVHHANLGVDRTRSSRRLDSLDPDPGYAGGMVSDARYPEGQLLGWTPGQVPRTAPAGMAWRLEPASDLVVQLHLQPTGKPEPVQVSVGLYFTDEVPTRSPVGLRLGRETIDIPAGEANYVITDSYTVPVDVDVFAVQPHAHNLGRRMEASATLPNGSIEPLVLIKDWDFKWQDVYRYVHPIALPKGSTIAMRFTYDNSIDNVRNPSRPPRHIVWGQNTTDEMGDLWVQMVTRDASDLSVLQRDVGRKQRDEDLAAYTRLVRAEPNNPLRHDAVGLLQLEGGDFEQAIAHFRASLRVNPDSAPTHYNLGVALSAAGKRAEAIDEFRAAVRIDPDYADAHNNLGAVLHAFGRLDEANEHYRRAIALKPENVEAHNNFGRLLSIQGRPAEAIAQFQQALSLRPDWPVSLTGLAWVQATAADATIRNPAQAIRTAERAAQITNNQDATVLDTLAAAYAAAGQFDRALAMARSAFDLAMRARALDLAADIRNRVTLYEQRTAYRVGR